RISEEDALKMGLVNKVVPSAELRDAARELAKKLADGPPIALRLIKQALNYASLVPIDVGTWLEAGFFGVLFSTKDMREGIEAFMSKRTPEFKGE
ncbi:3-hydroxyacyl-CoA dehydrogenase, partial [Candidatus Bathyarchaeota archaeon]